MNIIFDSDWRHDERGFLQWLADEREYRQDLKGHDDDYNWMEYSDYVFSLLDDEKANLDIETQGTILAYGSSSRWDGDSYGATPCGTNISSIFEVFDGDPIRYWIDDDGDVHGYFGLHDGPVQVVFREAGDDYLDKLDSGEPIGGLEKFRENTTSIAGYIADIYGW